MHSVNNLITDNGVLSVSSITIKAFYSLCTVVCTHLQDVNTTLVQCIFLKTEVRT